MKKANSKEILLLVLLLCVGVVLLVYFLAFQKMTESAENIRAQSVNLQKRVNQLKDYYDHVDDYNARIDECKLIIAGLLDKLPADIREEDTIMMAVEVDENAELVNFDRIAITNPKEELTVSNDYALQAQMGEDYPYNLIFASRSAVYILSTDYTNLKTITETINAYDERLSITNYDFSGENNELAGSIEVTYYFAVGTGKEYVPCDMDEYLAGLELLFGQPKEEENPEEGEMLDAESAVIAQ